MKLTTTNLQTVARRYTLAAWVARRDPWIAAAAVVAAFILLRFTARPPTTNVDHMAALPTPALVVVIATEAARPPAPSSPPARSAAQVASNGAANSMPRAVVAYDAPNGNPLGAIEGGRSFVVVASYGGAWLQIDVDGSGRVWVRATELYGRDVVDLIPPSAPEVVYVAAPSTPAPVVDVQSTQAAIDALNDPAQNGGNVAPEGCPFPIINGTCGDGTRSNKDDAHGSKSHAGGGGKSTAPNFDDVPTAAPGSTDDGRWCAAAASAGRATCVEVTR